MNVLSKLPSAKINWFIAHGVHSHPPLLYFLFLLVIHINSISDVICLEFSPPCQSLWKLLYISNFSSANFFVILLWLVWIVQKSTLHLFWLLRCVKCVEVWWCSHWICVHDESKSSTALIFIIFCLCTAFLKHVAMYFAAIMKYKKDKQKKEASKQNQQTKPTKLFCVPHWIYPSFSSRTKYN